MQGRHRTVVTPGCWRIYLYKERERDVVFAWFKYQRYAPATLELSLSVVFSSADGHVHALPTGEEGGWFVGCAGGQPAVDRHQAPERRHAAHIGVTRLRQIRYGLARSLQCLLFLWFLAVFVVAGLVIGVSFSSHSYTLFTYARPSDPSKPLFRLLSATDVVSFLTGANTGQPLV